MFRELRLFASELVHRVWHRPRRRRAFARRTGQYLHTTGEGLRFWLQPGQLLDHYIAVDGIFERRYLRFIARILPPGAVVIDIGANIGNHALYLHRQCSTVHCFEPNPIIVERLRRNVAANNAANVHVHPVGLGSIDATLKFAFNEAGNYGASGFFDPGKTPGFQLLELPVRNADAAIRALRLGRLDFIKMDVEGFEQKVIDGLGDTIARFQPLVAFEFHGHLAQPGDFDRLVAGFGPGYRIAEPGYLPEGSPLVSRVKYHFHHGDKMVLREVSRAEGRAYELLFAIPAGHPLIDAIVQPGAPLISR